jgi:hypothetical protein
MKNRLILSLCLLIALLAFATPAYAHRPMWGDSLGPIEIEDAAVSYAFYQQLKADEIDVFYFEGRQGEKFHAGIEIPDIAAYQEYNVSMALFGPGLPALEDESQLPPEYPEDLGAFLVSPKVTENFFEPFTQTNYLGRQTLDITLPADGQYYIIVWQMQGQAGKYVMDVGSKEEFGFLDLFAFPVWWVHVHWYFEHYLLIGSVSVVILALIGWTAFSKVRRISKGSSHVN